MAHFHLKDSCDVKTLLFCLAFNLAFVAIEAIVGWKSNSAGLLSDAGHNLSDSFGLFLSFLAICIGRNQNAMNKSISQSITIANGLFLIIATILIMVESVEKIIFPQEVNSKAVIITSLIAIVVNAFTAWLLKRDYEQNINIKVAYFHAAIDMLVSVGVVISGIIVFFTKWYIIDSIVGLFVSFVIVYPLVKLFKDILNYGTNRKNA
jgi:cobalt-zinc-cadmium efflux system protein